MNILSLECTNQVSTMIIMLSNMAICSKRNYKYNISGVIHHQAILVIRWNYFLV